MKQVINLLLEKDRIIEGVRKQYLLDYKKYEPHINIVYPFEVEDQNKLDEHIKDSIKETKPFNLKLKGVQQVGNGFYLYLLVNKGEDQLLKLHSKLSSGILSGFENKEMPKYVPHITLGIFQSQEEIDSAIEGLKEQNIEQNIKIESIQLLTLKEDDTIDSIKNYNL